MPSEELSPEELSTLLSSYMPDIPGYRVIRRIGKGGMSYVYLGVQVSLDRQVAIKVMSPEALTDEKSKQRFEQEAHTIAKLEHPCIVGVHEVGRTSQGLLYYVLPYLARGHLGQRDFTTDEARIVEVLRALLSALDYAHTRGIVHRDVKAENVLFDNADRPLLTDFGIALSRHDTSRITTAGLAVGSGGYMAPEQARGEAVDGRADLYSVGVLAYELLNGRLPYLSSDPLALALMHAQDPIPRLPAERRHWQIFLDRSMAKSPENRFRNAQQMLGVLNQVAAGDRRAGEDPDASAGATPRSPPWVRPTLFGLAGAAVLLVTVLAFRSPASPTMADPKFFTVREAPPVAAPAASAASLAPTAASTPGAADVTADTAGPIATSSSVLASDYAAVQASVIVQSLDFDPDSAGSRQLHHARRQIGLNRLSTPAGDNAIESVLAALAAGATAAEAGPAAEQVIDGLGKSLLDALAARQDDAARRTYRRTLQFATDSGHLEGEAWRGLREALPGQVLARIEQAYKAEDGAALALAKSLAGSLGIDGRSLEPAWSRKLAPARPGKVIRGDGPTVVLVSAPAKGTPGVAFMRAEVSRADYASFASGTGRANARCRNRLAPISIKKRTWVSPGFLQSGSHPAVCVSHEDATAYARWLSDRTGERYRLPTAAEWRQMADYRGTGDACRDGRIGCGKEGTGPASDGPESPLGIAGARGNVREWLGDCAGTSCRERLAGGLGWRDNAGRANALRSSGLAADAGFDDVGFRLVREIPAN